MTGRFHDFFYFRRAFAVILLFDFSTALQVVPDMTYNVSSAWDVKPLHYGPSSRLSSLTYILKSLLFPIYIMFYCIHKIKLSLTLLSFSGQITRLPFWCFQ